MEIEHSSPTMKPGRVYAGVVIEVPEPMGRELQDWRASFGDSAAGSVPAHITVLIAAREGGWESLVARVRKVAEAWKPFHVEINGTGTFRPVTPVVYLRVDKGYEECAQLHRDLNTWDLVSASPFEYHPHVTLAHAVADADLDRAQHTLRTYRASFLVDHLAVYEGDAHGEWHARERVSFANHDLT